MIYLAPNVYVLGYLSATKQLSGNSEENAYRFIQSGELRVIAFKFNLGTVRKMLIVSFSLVSSGL